MIELERDGYVLALAPEEGGLVLSLTWRDGKGRRHPLLKPAPASWPGDRPRLFGLWPMLPFANRAFGCMVDDGIRRFCVPVNDPPSGNIHGFGWQNPWSLVEADQASALLRHERRGIGDPYAYVAEMGVSLDEAGVRFDLMIESRAEEALPYGMGFHPWFPAAADTRLRLAAARELTFGEAFRATGCRDLPDRGAFAQGALYDFSRETAHSFIDWTGEAEIATPSLGLALTVSASPVLRHPVVWSPKGADFLCLEPQSHSIGAPSEAAARAVTPLQPLAKGQSLSGWMRIAPRSLE